MRHLYDKSDVPFHSIDYDVPVKKELVVNKAKNQGENCGNQNSVTLIVCMISNIWSFNAQRSRNITFSREMFLPGNN